ncbi:MULTISPECIES: cellulose biosynthesis cyclic di-GMP-binding regulatory protein BcsB [unclassified Enterobacter]|uniref:cellulose biosynthesis cyclic di-GMP-binding regulatory protein BcsB n=1 Tax=unclassified Enterobacter TaxID=2608935 RepID=UPI0008E8DFBF|nr:MULTISPECIES: cellulose biosynthesis cyclic di-GMP-binding regulatory protein BcsB [unclassified Enterobacter]SFR13035.1 cellulose synthase subunit [Enterobacter sp. kpr-6]
MKKLTTLAILVSALFITPLHAQDIAPDAMLPLDLPAPVVDTAPVAPPPAFVPSVVTAITVAQMGQPQGIVLSGGQLQGGINFTLPVGQVTTNAQLSLNLKVSPAMAARNTTMQLMLNGQPLGTVPLGAAESDISRFQLDIPAALMVSSNTISFKINDGDAMMCQRDLTDKYRVTILPDSAFSLEGQALDIGSDLSHFPRPFFDDMQMTPATITFAFPAKSTADTISAAALVSSWMGIQADYRGVSFAALRDRLPEQNGILIGHPGEQIGGLTLPKVTQPTLTIIDNPANPTYKLLLVVGKDENALRAAAWRLTRGNFALQTASLPVDAETIPQSKPYDAPRWIQTDRPVKLSELIRKDQSLTVNGIWHDALRVAFRAAPDLFLWDGETIPLRIGYRFPSENWIDENRSWLSMTMNDTFLHNLPVNKQGALETLWHKIGGDARQEQFDMPLEPYMIYGDNQLSLYFNIVPKASAPCSVLLNNNIKSRIDDDSWIDLSHTRHFALLPNLSYFVGASFPFTRLADYSQTTLLLPEKPTETQIATMLDMAARSGNATGTALAHNRVVLGIPSAGSNLELLRDRDVLAVTDLSQHSFNDALMKTSPFVAHNNMLSVREPTQWEKIQRWMAGDWSADGVDADRYFSSNESWRGFVSFRSPWSPERTVVTAMGSNDDQLSRLHGDLTSARINAGIRGDAAIITNENGVRSFRVGPQYPRGEMPTHLMIIWYANQHSGLLAILGLLFACILGLALYAVLKRRAHKRLNPDDNE